MTGTDKLAEARTRLAEHYLNVIKAAVKSERAFILDSDWLQLRALLEDGRAFFGNLVANLAPYWQQRAMFQELIYWSERAVAVYSAGEERLELNVHLSNLGIAYREVGQSEIAHKYLQESLLLSQDNSWLACSILNHLGLTTHDLG